MAKSNTPDRFFFLFLLCFVNIQKQKTKTGLLQPDRTSPYSDGGQRGSGAREQPGSAILFVLGVRRHADRTGSFGDNLFFAWGGRVGHPGEREKGRPLLMLTST